MKGQELLTELIAKRDYSGSPADEYAQLLYTLTLHIGEAIYPLLEKAQSNNKKLALNSNTSESDVLVDQYTVADIIFI